MRGISLPLADPQEFARWLVGKRRPCGTQGQVSKRSRVATRTIVGLENAQLSRVRTEALIRLARSLGISEKEMMEKAGSAHPDAFKKGIQIELVGPPSLEASLTREDLEFLLEMHGRLGSFSVRFALELLDLRVKRRASKDDKGD